MPPDSTTWWRQAILPWEDPDAIAQAPPSWVAFGDAAAAALAGELDLGERWRHADPDGVLTHRARSGIESRLGARLDLVRGRLPRGASVTSHPAAARLLATVLHDWTSDTTDFVAAAAVHGMGVEHIRVDTRWRRLLRRRTALVLCLEGGSATVFKPRSLGPEAAFGRVVCWLNELGFDPPLRTAVVEDRGDHGWMQHLRHEACPDDAAVSRFYRRAGAFLALAHALGARDLHAENLIAAGEHPVLVDVEHLLPADLSPRSEDDHASPEAERAGVFATGLLPTAGGRSGVAGLGDASGQRDSTAMNLPVLEGETVPLRDHGAALIRGFRDAYRLVEGHRDGLIATLGPLDGLDVACPLRPSRAYRLVADRALDPDRLRDGGALGRAFSELERPFRSGRIDRRWSPLYPHELRGLSRLDASTFVVHAADTMVRAAVATGARLAASPVELLRIRSGRIGSADLEAQLRRLRLAI